MILKEDGLHVEAEGESYEDGLATAVSARNTPEPGSDLSGLRGLIISNSEGRVGIENSKKVDKVPADSGGGYFRHGQHRINSDICGQRTHLFSSLCEKCTSMFDDWVRVIEAFDKGDSFVEFSHWKNVLSFEKAASDGCHLCVLFLDEFKEEEIAGALRAMGDSERDKLYIVVLMDGNQVRKSGWGSWSLNLHLPQLDGITTAVMAMSPSNFSEPSPSMPSSNWNEASISLCKTWINRCRSLHHRSCSRPDGLQNPTRLIVVNNEKARLVLTADLPELVYYTTLSHCWGTLKILRLLKNNLIRLQEEIPWDELCKTFQDACIVTQELGFEYIWIDSLCIIQDEEEDWARESLRMSTVYGCSSLNISAASAKDGSIGCFSTRNPRSIEKVQLCLKKSLGTGSQGTESTYLIYKPSTSSGDECEGTLYDCAPQTLHKKCVSGSPLGQRAWVLQERVLANRSLHFSSQLFWECKGVVACETFQSSLPGVFQWIEEDLNNPDNSEHWFALIWLYSRCKLTYGKDKLIAISGIAQSITKRYNGDQYLAGLWRRDILKHLRWRVVYHHPRPDPYRAPSWSWASVDGGVHFRPAAEKLEHKIEILDARIEPVGDSIYGDIRQGVLTIRCNDLVPFTATLRLKSKVEKYTINSGEQSFDCNLSLFFDCSDTNRAAEYHLLSAAGPHCRSGYILEATGVEKGQYRRVGDFECYPQNEEERRAFQELQNATECLAPDSAYVESAAMDEHGNQRYVITIV